MAILLFITATVWAIAIPGIESLTISTVVSEYHGENTCFLQANNKAIQNTRDNIEAIIDRLHAVPECGDGVWYRAAHFNMSDPLYQCPPAWREYNSSGVRACGRPVTSTGSCSATVYTIGLEYRRVCGRVIGYHVTSPDAFHTNRNIDQIYLDGISITRGSPRNHVWSYVGAWTESERVRNLCPCRYSGANQPPAFVGDNYYCESANPDRQFIYDQVFPNDKLWDGLQCEHEGTCCITKSPPWFSVDLTNPTSDDIEVRICGNESTANEDTPVELLELFFQ